MCGVAAVFACGLVYVTPVSYPVGLATRVLMYLVFVAISVVVFVSRDERAKGIQALRRARQKLMRHA